MSDARDPGSDWRPWPSRAGFLAFAALAFVAAATTATGLLPPWASALAILALAAAGIRLGMRSVPRPERPAEPPTIARAGRSDSILGQLPEPVVLVDGRG